MNTDDINKLMNEASREQRRLADDDESQREEYECGEVESAKSIDHQRELGNKNAGM
jgi:hypothetical protein